MTLADPSFQSLTCSLDYFNEVIMPNYRAFFNDDANFVNTINLATSLYHFHEWLFSEYQTEIYAMYGEKFPSPGKFWQHLELLNKKFGYIKDMTNASKHVKIGTQTKGRQPSTTMRQMSDTHIEPSLFDPKIFDTSIFDARARVVFEDSSDLVSMEDCARQLYSHWKVLIEEFSGTTVI